MADSAVTNPATLPHTRSFRLRVLASFFAIYFLWGTTFLAIRVAVAQLPPLFAAGTRFFVAGLALYGFLRVRGVALPTQKQWRNLAVTALLLFVAEYGPLFWAEKFVPSGVVSVLAATIPLMTLVAEMILLRQQHFRWSVAISTVIGFGGVALLLVPGHGVSFGLLPCLAVLGGSLSWSIGTVFSRSLDLPRSRPLASGAMMMIGGAVLLALSAACGEMHPLPHVTLRAAAALAYLIVFGSLLAFTAFVWLLAHMPATSISSYAYVNPIVAIIIGHFLAAEPVTARTLAGTALVLLSVFLVLRPRKPAPA